MHAVAPVFFLMKKNHGWFQMFLKGNMIVKKLNLCGVAPAP
jgi:hypothetical protein